MKKESDLNRLFPLNGLEEIWWHKDIDQAIETYKMAITSSEITGEKSSKLAGLCLRLSWLFRIKEDREEELRFMRWSTELYGKAYQWEDFDGRIPWS